MFTNKDILYKSVTDFTPQEKNEIVAITKNLLDIILRNCTEEEKKAILNSYGTCEIPARLKG